MSPENPTFDDILTVREKLLHMSISHWMQNELFSYLWWINLSFTVLPWLIWWRFVEKRRVIEILCFGSLVGLSSGIMDGVGTNFVWWGYPSKLIPIMPPLFPIDITILPILYMYVFQIAASWGKFFVGVVLLAFLFSFVVEPILVSVQLYRLRTWSYLYSFPIYVVMGVGLKLFVDWIGKAQKKEVR